MWSDNPIYSDTHPTEFLPPADEGVRERVRAGERRDNFDVHPTARTASQHFIPAADVKDIRPYADIDFIRQQQEFNRACETLAAYDYLEVGGPGFPRKQQELSPG